VSDILIRDVPDTVIAEIDAQANRVGISRVEYVRRTLLRESTRVKTSVTVDDLHRSDSRLEALLDEALMNDAWR